MKKLITLILVFAMFCSLASPTLATESFPNKQPTPDKNESVYISEAAEGIWVKQNDTFAENRESVKVQSHEKFDDIYTSNSNQYFLKVEENHYVPVTPHSFALNDHKAIRDLKVYDIPAEVLEGIESMAAFAEQNNCTEAEATIFVHDAAVTKSALNTLPRTTTTWNGHRFYHYQIYFTNMYAGWTTIAEGGATTQAVLSGIKELLGNVVGNVNGPIGTAANIYSYGRTALETWIAATGRTPIYGHSSNNIQALITYDIYLKYTYYYEPMMGQEYIGCSSQKAIITNIETNTFLYDSTGGYRKVDNVRPNKPFVTPNYNYPESIAYNYYGGSWTESVRGQIYNRTIYFTFPSFPWPGDWP